MAKLPLTTVAELLRANNVDDTTIDYVVDAYDEGIDVTSAVTEKGLIIDTITTVEGDSDKFPDGLRIQMIFGTDIPAETIDKVFDTLTNAQ